MLGKFKLGDSPAPTSLTPISSHKPRSQKRPRVHDENEPPPGMLATPTPAYKKQRTISASVTPMAINIAPSQVLHAAPAQPLTPASSAKPQSRRYLTIADKLDRVFAAIDEANWTFSEFVMHASLEVNRERRHAKAFSRFLQGQSKFTPANVLHAWDNHPDGKLKAGAAEEELMYSLSVPYTEIKSVRPALSSFAAQKCLNKLTSEAAKAVKPTSGLHASAKRMSHQKLEWAGIGESTVERVQALLLKHMPLSFGLMLGITGEDLRSPGDELEGRRPGTLVTTHALSSLLFKRNNEARLLPLSLGLLAFAYSTPVDLIAYCSRIGLMPAYTTISNSLDCLARVQAAAILEHGKDPSTVGFLQIDNVQNYLRVRDQRIGSANTMNVGIAATYCELRGVNPAALDLKDKKLQVSKNERANLTVLKLLSFLDMPHLNTVFSLHWLRVLVDYIPELAHLKPQVSALFRSRAKKLTIPAGATPVYPLSSSGKNETITTELKDAMHDFLSQIGQKNEDYLRRLVLVGGDGLTFQRLLEVQRYLQFHPDDLESLALVEPILAVWHTEWTDVSRLFEAHWVSSTSADPSSLGHSAAAIGRPPPPNLKKVDYYPAVDLLYLVLEVRMLDCWRLRFNECGNILKYFSDRAASGSLPDLSELDKIAQELHHTYSTTRAIYLALGDPDAPSSSEWIKSVPTGSFWSPKAKNSTTAPQDTSDEEPKMPETHGRHEKGDRVLANSITFMRDALLSREISYAIAEGDAGRVYEVMKVLLFSFAGSSHTKYCTYLLEEVTRLELESSNTLLEGVLSATLVNLSGLEGTCTAGDIMQEYFNRLIEAIVEKKGIDYGHAFARNIISPNLGHFARIKINLRSGLGLAARSGKHTAPHENPEVRKLMHTYQIHDLHKRRAGRVYQDTDRDDFSRGIVKLEAGRLKKWVADTTHHRGLLSKSTTSAAVSVDAGDVLDQEDDSDIDGGMQTFGVAEMIDGRLVIETFSDDSICSAFDEYMADTRDN